MGVFQITENLTGIIDKGLSWLRGTEKSHCGPNHVRDTLFIVCAIGVGGVITFLVIRNNTIQKQEKQIEMLQNQVKDLKEKIRKDQNEKIEKLLEAVLKKGKVVDELHHRILELEVKMKKEELSQITITHILLHREEGAKGSLALTDNTEGKETKVSIEKVQKKRKDEPKVDNKTIPKKMERDMNKALKAGKDEPKVDNNTTPKKEEKDTEVDINEVQKGEEGQSEVDNNTIPKKKEKETKLAINKVSKEEEDKPKVDNNTIPKKEEKETKLAINKVSEVEEDKPKVDNNVI